MPKFRNVSNPSMSFDGYMMFRDLLEKSGVDVSQITVTSASRDKKHNTEIGGAKNSRHIHGDAIDLGGKETDEENQKLIKWLKSEDGQAWSKEWNAYMTDDYKDGHFHIGVHDGAADKSDRVKNLYTGYEEKWKAMYGENGMVDISKVNNWAVPNPDNLIDPQFKSKYTVDGLGATAPPKPKAPTKPELRNTSLVVNSDYVKENKKLENSRKAIEQMESELAKAEAKGDDKLVAKINKDLQETVKEYRAEQVDAALQVIDEEMSPLREAQKAGTLTTAQALRVRELKEGVEQFGIDGAKFFEAPYINLEDRKLLREFDQYGEDRKKALIKENQDSKKGIWGVWNNFWYGAPVNGKRQGGVLSGMPDDNVRLDDLINNMPDMSFHMDDVNLFEISDKVYQKQQIQKTREHEEAQAQYEKDLAQWEQNRKEANNESTENVTGDEGEDDKGSTTEKTGGNQDELSPTKDPWYYNPEDQSAFEKIGGVEGVMGLGMLAKGLAEGDQVVVPEEERVDPMLLNHIQTVKRLSEIGMPAVEQAAMRESLDESFIMAKKAMADSVNMNRGQLLAGITGLSAERQRGALTIEAKKAQMRREALDKYGQLLGEVNKFKADQGNLAKSREFELDKMQADAAGEMAGAGLQTLIESINNAKEFGPGSLYDMRKSYMLHTLQGAIKANDNVVTDIDNIVGGVFDNTRNTPAEDFPSAGAVASDPNTAAKVNRDINQFREIKNRFAKHESIIPIGNRSEATPQSGAMPFDVMKDTFREPSLIDMKEQDALSIKTPKAVEGWSEEKALEYLKDPNFISNLSL